MLREVHSLKRKVEIAVFSILALCLPLYHFIGFSVEETTILAILGVVIAVPVIRVTFGHIMIVRKHGSYPALLIQEAGDVDALDQAGTRSLAIIQGLLQPETSFLALVPDSRDPSSHTILAANGLTPEAATGRLDAYSGVLQQAMDVRYPMEVPSYVGDIRVMIVPVIVVKKAIGVLYLAGYRNNTDLADKRLLVDIGNALGITLDNLRQREELLQKESRLSSLMMGSPVVLFAVDTHGTTTYMQGQGLQRLGVTPVIVVGRPIEDVYANYPQILQGFRRAFAGGEVTSTVAIVVQGVRVTFEYRLVPERDELGRVIGVIGVATDITERKRAEDAFRESQRALETLVSNLPGFAYRCVNDEDWPLEYVSDGVEDVTGFPATDFVPGGMAFGDLIHEEDRKRVWNEVQAGVDAREAYQLEYRVVTRWGEEKWVWEQGQAVYSDGGEVVALEGFISDITERKRAEQRLSESEERYRDLFENARDPMFSYSLQGKFLSANDRFLHLLGYSRQEISVLDVGKVVPIEFHSFAPHSLRQTYEGDTQPYELEVITKSGERIPLEIAVRIVLDDEGRPSMVQGIGRDIRERRRAELALEVSEARYRDLFENANDIIFTHDLAGRFQSVNRKAEEIGGYTRDEILARTVWDVVAPEFHQLAVDHMKLVTTGHDPGPYELEIIARDGHRIPVEVSERVLYDDDGTPVLVQGIARDIRERRQAEETIRQLAYHDPLTGLPDRALFEDRLSVAIAQARRGREMLAVMFLDLDHFKVVNDTLGHNAGDRLLESVARDLQTIVREGDTVARVGGDEFTLLLPLIERLEDATDIAGRILECLQQPRVIDGQEFRTTGSIGITTFPEDGEGGEDLLRNADTAMYRAKERGRDNYQLYTRAMNERMLERLSFENDLRHALARDEFVLFYQPIVNVKSGKFVGAEALVRWRHPEKGIIPPDDFIPFAEESGLIVDIGESVLRNACEQLRAWDAVGLRLERIAVNLSARQLQQEDIVDRIADILAETGVQPTRIQLEITEGSVLKNVDYIISTLTRLSDMGIGLALDDFGTGYSSLTYLKRFPIDAVKVDRSFIRDLLTDPNDATIVTTVIAMADTLRLKVIAEGVETECQLQFLKGRDCDEYQGFLVSPPVPADQFAELNVVRQGLLALPSHRKRRARASKP